MGMGAKRYVTYIRIVNWASQSSWVSHDQTTNKATVVRLFMSYHDL